MSMKKLSKSVIGSALMASFLLTACGSGDGSSDSDSDAVTNDTFPASVTVASPFETTEAADGSVSDGLMLVSPRFATSYSGKISTISSILTGTTAASCRFDPELFLETDGDSACYGPTIDYEDHIDGGGGDGQLPSGDLGMWFDTETASGNACAAAQLNSRMNGVSNRTHAAFMTAASMLCTLNINGLSLPVNASEDLTAEMTALGVTDVTFASATLAHSDASGTDEYTYTIDFTYAPSGDISVELVHVKGATAGEYQGRLSYLVDGEFAGGNCPSNEVTLNNSALYEGDSDTVALEVRSATFCGLGVDGRVDGIVNPEDGYVPVTNTDGWGNNFSIFTGNFDSTTQEGDFTYAWQAGPGDSNSRIFNFNVDSTMSGGVISAMTAEAYFGFGEDISDTDGTIQGFICNWAGPGSSHSLSEQAQYQQLELDTSTGLFTAATSNIAYAPVNDCEYDGTSTFVFDVDDDGSLADEVANVPFANELAQGIDGSDADAVATVEELISGAGFTLPTPPSNL